VPPVIEVNRPHAHTRARRGKSDAVDAEAVARKVLAGECTTIPKDTAGIVEAIRQLHVTALAPYGPAPPPLTSSASCWSPPRPQSELGDEWVRAIVPPWVCLCSS
jgi:hypothetical protein